VLRRQIAMPFRKPLIVFSPKSLLRHPDAKSSFDQMVEGTSFLRIIPDDGPASQSPSDVKRLVLCSGKIFYELIKERNSRGLDNSVAITRLEQLSPFPWDLLTAEIKKYPNAEIVWSQEEHKNQGFWSFVEPHIETIFKHVGEPKDLRYAGRKVSPTTATGSKFVHKREHKNHMEDTFGGV
jgi:2-oxoglutarate dehydrogenase E1 component